jgi:hypothetical protein
MPPKRCGTETLVWFAEGWTVSARAPAIFVTSGRIGCRYFERPHETAAV